MKMFLIVLLPLACFILLVIISTRGTSLTGRATVVSHRISGRNYLVTFRLSDGEELELYVFQNQYNELREGTTGQLTWCKDSMGSFEPEMEVTA